MADPTEPAPRTAIRDLSREISGSIAGGSIFVRSLGVNVEVSTIVVGIIKGDKDRKLENDQQLLKYRLPSGVQN